MRWGGFAVGDDGFDLIKARAFEHAGERAFGKSEPAVAVKFARFFELMLHEIEHDQASATFEHAIGSVDRALRVFGVMEGLAENCEIDRAFAYRWFFEVAEAVLEVGESVFDGELLSVLDHLGREVDGDDFFGALREQLRERAFACAKVGNGFVIEDFDERLG